MQGYEHSNFAIHNTISIKTWSFALGPCIIEYAMPFKKVLIYTCNMIVNYNSDSSNFNELLLKDNSITIHQKNLQVLATDIHKTINDLNPTFMKEIFKLTDTKYYLRN